MSNKQYARIVLRMIGVGCVWALICYGFEFSRFVAFTGGILVGAAALKEELE